MLGYNLLHLFHSHNAEVVKEVANMVISPIQTGFPKNK